MTKNCVQFGYVMLSSLAVLSFIRALTIDNQLTVIRNDCYERMAIGQRLDPKNIYKTFHDTKTVKECQMECTKERDICKSFSFGIGPKGNTTCELAADHVKETIDLKPIGTRAETDFDLYIKKLDCQIVIDKTPHFGDTSNHAYHNDHHPDHHTDLLGTDNRPINTYNRPSEHNHNHGYNLHAENSYDNHEKPVSEKPENHYPVQNGYDKPGYSSQKPSAEYETGHVQTLVSIAHGPDAYLDPVHGILVSGKPNRPSYENDNRIPSRPLKPSYGESERPPFRPQSLNHPYEEHVNGYHNKHVRPLIDERYDSKPLRPYGPDFGYESRPERPSRPIDDAYDKLERPFRPENGYEKPVRPLRPLDNGYDRPESLLRPDDYGYDTPDHPLRPVNNVYNRPERPFRPENGYERPHDPPRPQRPIDDGYNRPKEPPRPLRPNDNGYDRPDKPIQHLRPENGYDRPDRPLRPLDDGYDRPGKPLLPLRPENGYDRPDRPLRPLDNGYDGPAKPLQPLRPENGYDLPERPLRPLDNDYDRPQKPEIIINRYDRPLRPDNSYDRPTNIPRPLRPENGYENEPLVCCNEPQRPERPDNGYNSRPERPLRPVDHGYDRPDDLRYFKPVNGYSNRPEIPIRPLDNEYDRPIRPIRPDNGYNSIIDRPIGSLYDRPLPNRYGERPNRPINGYGSNIDRYDDISRPIRPEPVLDSYSQGPVNPLPNRYGSVISHPDYYNDRQYESGYLFRPIINRFDDRPSDNEKNYDSEASRKPETTSQPYNTKPSSTTEKSWHGDKNESSPDYGLTTKPSYGKTDQANVSGAKPIVTESIGVHGEHITSIITELHDNACFRRVLAGKRVTGAFVKRALTCESVEECQQECGEEKRFTCEGFNYRLDPRGRGKGDCELLDLPLSRMDISRDVYLDRDYDYYEKDRNAASINCRQYRPGGGGYRYGDRYGSGSYGYAGSYGGSSYYSGDYGGNRRHDDYGLRRPSERWPEDNRNSIGRPEYDDRRYDYGYRRPVEDYGGYRPSGNRRGDFSYHQSHDYESNHRYHYSYHYDNQDRFSESHKTGLHYLPAIHYHRPQHYDPYEKSYEPYLPPNRRYERPFGDTSYLPEKPRGPWGFSNDRWGSYGGSYGNFGIYKGQQNYNQNRNDYDRRNYYLPPPKVEKPQDWGLYGGSYGTGGGYLQYGGYKGNRHSYDYHRPPSGGGSSYLPKPSGYLPWKPAIDPILDNSLLPAEPRFPAYNFLKDECSLRSATGFRLHKAIIKKFYSVPSIYECELICFREKDFRCSSYAYRYSLTLSTPTDNCYLSSRNYKELDYYTDLQPDRDFDIYTMNNMNRCEQPLVQGKDNSDCFWRVRSGQRLDHKVVRDSLHAKTIVECQIACLHSLRFTCRAYSYRYGSSVIGGSFDNCLLTDWPFYELDPRVNFIPEAGFEVYERGSYGHGCEPDHFGIRGQHHERDGGNQVDQLCYVGFGSPARLLPGATKKSLYTRTELDCKAECSKSREGTLFQCMSFSYRSGISRGLPNCELSDILQRDLLPNVDYVPDPDSWLFAWDNYNPQCVALANEPVHNNHLPSREPNILESRMDIYHALDTWRVYSVNGYPCKRGTKCKENIEAGFWFCEIEGGEHHAWDYCCHPDHRCGSSYGYPYQWCYVGPQRTQWRKCSDRYYPYLGNYIDRLDQPERPYHEPPWVPHGGSYLPNGPSLHRPGIRPDRPPGVPPEPPIRPSLDEYEMQFDNEFLKPPKPGGFGQPRRWPVSYLHKEMPPNTTSSVDPKIMSLSMTKPEKSDRSDNGQKTNPKYAAIQNLINVIKSNDLNNVQYHIANDSNKQDDILLVKIPLPTNFTKEASDNNKEKKSEKIVQARNNTISLEPVIFEDEPNTNTRSNRRAKFLTSGSNFRVSNSLSSINPFESLGSTRRTQKFSTETTLKPFGVESYNFFTSQPRSPRKGFITRMNITDYGLRSKNPL